LFIPVPQGNNESLAFADGLYIQTGLNCVHCSSYKASSNAQDLKESTRSLSSLYVFMPQSVLLYIIFSLRCNIFTNKNPFEFQRYI